ncbi:hypothetical protein BC939DRAFT_454679 [Gamsiella multidivaricata]|uniref:uncharacterized protein n=1 Tax=Gamsiella multidivaricata TaxID=101098 RepID=UPI0022200726|nr:uncharacterized protein BC939DRAFT_454679 [Gamsiella multidivaricata]KAI7821854.1 hypothetical protein BC939DRAFT_454679 [Gamsiella multidivaricata]
MISRPTCRCWTIQRYFLRGLYELTDSLCSSCVPRSGNFCQSNTNGCPTIAYLLD